MSLYILDTDMLTLYENKHPVVLQRVLGVPPPDLAVTIITVEEQLRGWFTNVRQAKRPADLANAYDRFTSAVQEIKVLQIISFSLNCVHRFNALLALKLNISKMDLRIAAIALEHGAIVVTRNVRDFGRVPNLTIEDWSL